MKTEFELDTMLTHIVGYKNGTGNAKAKIIGKAPKHKTYVAIAVTNDKNTLADLYIKDKDLEKFAINILTAIGSKRLKPAKT